ncbi:hypothetical protein LCGC14_2335250 [marine sediment metagenome]|uniref:Uncharacterized protein n=1 Tax=marine sediment metagenome TaxID=412755 RepID=A0A0F9ERF5_9ZZZZ
MIKELVRWILRKEKGQLLYTMYAGDDRRAMFNSIIEVMSQMQIQRDGRIDITYHEGSRDQGKRHSNSL